METYYEIGKYIKILSNIFIQIYNSLLTIMIAYYDESPFIDFPLHVYNIIQGSKMVETKSNAPIM